MRSVLWSFVLVASTACACGGAAPETARVVAPAAPVASALPARVTTPVAAPRSLALWIHVAQPARLAALAQTLAPSQSAQPSCAKGDATACLALIDSTRPVDVAVAIPGGEDDVDATAFSVTSVAAFRDQASKAFAGTSEPTPGMLRLAPKVLCDVGDAGESLRVVCGSERGLRLLGPWLRTSPTLETKGLARAKVFAAPLAKIADASLAASSSLRQLAHDFAGASVELSSTGAADSVSLDVDVDLRDVRSPWARALLAADATAGGAVPDAFGRLSRDATATFYAPGGALGSLLGLLEPTSLEGIAPKDRARAQGALDELRAVFARPVACAHAIDFDAAQTALAAARRASDKDRKKADAALDRAFGSYFVCGVEEPVAAAEKLARTLVAVTPKERGEKTTIRPGASLGLPRGAFVVEATKPGKRPAKPSGATKAHAKGAHRTTAASGTAAKPETDVLVVVPDGDTTWVVSGEDTKGAVQLAKRLLAQPKGPLPGIAVTPGTIVTGSLSSRLGGFTWDLAMRSLDALQATLSHASPGRVTFALSRRGDGTNGALSLRLSSDAATLKTLSIRAMPLVLLAGVALAALSPASSASSASPPTTK